MGANHAQVGPWQDAVDSGATFCANKVVAADSDGDGGLDMASASGSLGTSAILWHENSNGDGTLWTIRVTASNVIFPASVEAADINGGGRMDVLVGSPTQDELTWDDNLVGDGSTWGVQSISNDLDILSRLYVADVDGDGDLDVLSSASFPVNQISRHEDLTPFIFIGSGVNAAGSLTILSGEPTIGTDLVLGIDNPLGTQDPGALPLLVVANTPDPQFPSGTLIPGYGMQGAFGELLVSLNQADLITGLTGSPAAIAVSIPADPTLVGFCAYLQGVLLDTSGPTLKVGLTAAVEMTLQP